MSYPTILDFVHHGGALGGECWLEIRPASRDLDGKLAIVLLGRDNDSDAPPEVLDRVIVDADGLDGLLGREGR